MSIIYYIKKNYETVEECAYGYASGYLVSKNQKKGFLNKQGKTIIPAIYDDIEIGSTYFVVKNNGRKGVVDEENELVIPIIFDSIKPVEVHWPGMRNQFFFIVTIDGKNALLDEKNKFVTPLISSEISISRKWLILTKNKRKGVGSMANINIDNIKAEDIAEVWLSFVATVNNRMEVILGKKKIDQKNINIHEEVIEKFGQWLKQQPDVQLMAG